MILICCARASAAQDGQAIYSSVLIPCILRYSDGVYLHSCLNLLLMTIEAAQTLKKDCIYQAAMLDPHTAAELSIDDIVSMCDELIEAHGSWLPKFH